ALNDSTRVLNQNIGSQTNVNVILNQTVIQQQQPTVQTTNQQQMVAININGNQTLIPLSMFTKLLQQKYSSTQQSTIPSTTVTQQVAPTQIIQNGTTQYSTGPIPQPNSSNTQSTVPTTLRFVRPSTTTTTTTTTNSPTSNLMMMTSGPRLSTPILSKPQTGNIIVQVASNDTLQSKLFDK
ncbi:unnamed protein product, partial [Rotaria magnacalcarata]